MKFRTITCYASRQFPEMSIPSSWLESHNNMVVALKGETDRSAALFASSFLHHEMQQLLLAYLVDDKSSAKLFDGYHPLSTFSGLIDVAFGLGLMTRSMREDLTFIRKIRNHFAHHHGQVTFDDAPVTDWCRELTTAKGVPTQDGNKWQADNRRDQFLFSSTITLVYFERFVRSAIQRSIPAYPPGP